MSYTYKYPMQTVTADAVVIRGTDVLLIQRNTDPFKGKWALPGGHMDETDENTAMTADRELQEETGISFSSVHRVGQIGAYSQIGRDPRGRYVTVAYLYISVFDAKFSIDSREVKKAEWVSYLDLTEKDLAFDHFKIIKDALEVPIF